MKPIDLSEDNIPITPEQVETPVGCGGKCGGKCGCSSSEAAAQGKCKKEGSCCSTRGCCKRCCCVLKIVLKLIAAGLLFYAGYLYGLRH
jgi:hypothetical protein